QGRSVGAAGSRRARPGERTAHDGRLHRRGGGAPHRPVQPRRPEQEGAGRGAGVRGEAGARAVVRARDLEGVAGPRVVDGPGHRARLGGHGAGGLHAGPELPRVVRGVQGEARAAVRMSAEEARGMPDTGAVRAFLEQRYIGGAGRFAAFCAEPIAPLPAPAAADPARTQAREILELLGKGGWLAPIGRLDLRACALAREALAHASPLADAVFALQALGAAPLLLAGDGAQRTRWADPLVRGDATGAFVMTDRKN